MHKKGVSMIRPRFLLMSASAVATLAAARWSGGSGVRADGADYVRWDIINVTVPLSATPPVTTISSGGVAFALADANLKIKLAGSGTFVAPASGGESSAVTGGGTWETFSGCPSACKSTGSGGYEVTRLASWEFGNLATGAFIDKILDGDRVHRNAVLLIP